ncbi:MAG TPA: sigma-70 family RNA polymerase sigma factor [Clostridia bacterium]|nr:sigma-70 family RNA polymerase sigma factor [Clostridia bacterium]
MKSDAQLLRDYALNGTESAFSELVGRYVNLVYSAALRQVNSSDMAADVSQQVFISLSRAAGSLPNRMTEDSSLAGWLCRSTRNVALNLLRNEGRRQAREMEAMQTLHLHQDSDSEPGWDQLSPVLDDAMSELSELEYDTLVLRFCQKQDLRSLGKSLGITDDAAQKRVTRALDRLRGLLEQRGLRTSTTVLGLALSAHAVQAAPLGLAVSSSTAAVLQAPAIGAGLIKGIVMTTLQKTIIATSVAVAIATGVYQAHQASQLRRGNESIRQQQTFLTQQIEQLSEEREQALRRMAALGEQKDQRAAETAELLRLRGEVGRLRQENRTLARASLNNGDPAEMESLLTRVNQLKARVKELPEHQIPELDLITQSDWVKVVEGNKTGNERAAMAELRDLAKSHFASLCANALAKFKQTTKRYFPADLEELKPYINSQLNPDVLDNMFARYEILPASAVPSVFLGGDQILSERTPVDEEYDHRYVVGGSGSYGATSFKPSLLETLFPAARAYASAHQGKEPTDPGQLTDYVKTSAERAALQKVSAALDLYKEGNGKPPASLAELQPYLHNPEP